MRRLLTVIGVLVALPGCSTPTELDHRRVIGVIEFAGAIATIVAPDTVQVGNSFTATVNSLGSSSCTTPDGVELTLTPSEARVTPYDLVPEADSRAVCTADLAARPHPVELRFTKAGPATIVAQGLVWDVSTDRRTHGTVTKQLVVLP
jgi:hypothetical protein